MNIKKELKMTQTTVSQLLSAKRTLSASNRDLRFQIMTLKKQLLNTNTSFVVQKSKMKTKIIRLKQENDELKHNLNSFMMDDFFTDPKTGIIDITQPTTPSKPKREFVR